MKRGGLEKFQVKIESVTRRWWFYLLFVLLQFIPPYTSKGYVKSEAGIVAGEILSHSLVFSYTALWPIFKIIPLILFISIIFLGNKVTSIFDVYGGVTYILFAFLQSIAVTEKFGLGILTVNLIMFLFVAAFWFWEVIVQKNDFSPRKQAVWRYWVIPFAFLAFWYPANPSTLMPDFNPIYLITNSAGLAFCMMTPVYLAILTLYYPRVNIATLRVTSLVGIIIGLYNMFVNFVFALDELWWNGILHIPLLSISLYAFTLSFHRFEEVKGN